MATQRLLSAFFASYSAEEAQAEFHITLLQVSATRHLVLLKSAQAAVAKTYDKAHAYFPSHADAFVHFRGLAIHEDSAYSPRLILAASGSAQDLAVELLTNC